jgi:hypothetical protein
MSGAGIDAARDRWIPVASSATHHARCHTPDWRQLNQQTLGLFLCLMYIFGCCLGSALCVSSPNVFQGRQFMKNPMRMVVLAALTAFVVSSFPTGSPAEVAGNPCDTSKDCPQGFRCEQKDPKSSGVCVSTPSSTVAGSPCDSSKDCPSGFRCKHKDPKSPGVCVGTPSKKTVAGHPCDTSEDCPPGSGCKHAHPKRPGVCVGTPAKKRTE